MEPCDLSSHLENVFSRKYKYKILKTRKIDCQNFECELRIALNNCEDVKEWLTHFKGSTNTEWLLRQSTTCEENILNQLYVCQNSSYGKKRKYDDDESSKSDFNCKAAISVKVKKGGKKTYYQDEYVKKGFKGIIRICFIHSHLIDKAEALNMARQSEETKRAFIGYFTEGMSPSVAIRYHEEVLLLERHEDLGSSRKNPPEHWVYSFYEDWTKQTENRLQLESQLTRASVFWKLQNRSIQRSSDGKSKNIVKLCKMGEDVNSMSVPADLHVSDEDDVDSDSENQYDSCDEDSIPQVSTSYVSVSTTSHQSTVSSAPLKLNVPSNINITRRRSLQVRKNSCGSNKKPSTNTLPLFVRITKGTNNSQHNSMQIITTSHEDINKSTVTFLTATANSRKYMERDLGKTTHVLNAPKENFAPAKTYLVATKSKEHPKVSESLPNDTNVSKTNILPFIETSDEINLRTTINMKPVYVRIKKCIVNKDAPILAKSQGVQKETGPALQQILKRFQNSAEPGDTPSNKNNQFLPNNEMTCSTDVPNLSGNPVLKKSVQNFVHSSLTKKLLATGNVLKDVQNQDIKDIQNSPKQISEQHCNKTLQLNPGKKVITISKESILSLFGNQSIDKKKDKNNSKNSGEHTYNHLVNSKLLSYDYIQQSKCVENINNTNKLTATSNDSFNNSQSSKLVTKNFCDIAQAYSSTSLKSFSPDFNQFGSVQSIKNPISTVIPDLGVPKSSVLFDSIDSNHQFPQHSSNVTSTLCKDNEFSEISQDNRFQDSKSFERVPILGCSFPLTEDYYSTLSAEHNSLHLRNQNTGGCQILPFPFSKDSYNSNQNICGQVVENQNDLRDPLLSSESFCNKNNPPIVIEETVDTSFSSDLNFSIHDSEFSDSCNDINSSQLPAGLDMSNEASLQHIFPDLSKLELELNNFTFPSAQDVDLYSNHASAGNHLSLKNTYTDSSPELQVNPVSLFDSSEDNVLLFPENLKGNIEDIDFLKNILKCNKLENSDLEDFLQQPENYNQKDILEKWDSEMCRLRSLLEQNIHDRKLMREANQFLERIKESVVTPSELAILFSSVCNLKSKERKY